MFISAFRGEVIEGDFETEEVIDVRTAWAVGFVDVFCEDLGVLGAEELGVFGGAYVD